MPGPDGGGLGGGGAWPLQVTQYIGTHYLQVRGPGVKAQAALQQAGVVYDKQLDEYRLPPGYYVGQEEARAIGRTLLGKRPDGPIRSLARQWLASLNSPGAGGGGGSPADNYPRSSSSSPPFIFARGPRTRGRKRKKKSKLRSAAAVLAGRVLQTGEEVFGGLLDKARGATRYVEPEFERLLKKVPSEFERLIYRTPDFVPGAARTAATTAARTAATVAGSAAAVIAGVLYPSTIGVEPPWSPPVRPARRPLPAPTRAPALPAPAPTRPRLPPARPTATAPKPAPRPVAIPAPTPGPSAPVSRAPAPTTAPRPAARPAPAPTKFEWSSFLAPLALGISAPRSAPRSRPRVVAWPQQTPLTRTETAPAQSNCDCSKPTRTRRERKDRCTNPVISRTRKGDTITITRRIKCPESSRKKPRSASAR